MIIELLIVLSVSVFAMVAGKGWFPHPNRCKPSGSPPIEVDCAHCIDDLIPAEFEVILADLGDGPEGECDECSNANGTWIIPFNSSSATNCNYRLSTDIGLGACTFIPTFQIQVNLRQKDASNAGLKVNLNYTQGNIYGWEDLTSPAWLAAPADCLNFNHNLPHSGTAFNVCLYPDAGPVPTCNVRSL